MAGGRFSSPSTKTTGISLPKISLPKIGANYGAKVKAKTEANGTPYVPGMSIRMSRGHEKATTSKKEVTKAAVDVGKKGAEAGKSISNGNNQQNYTAPKNKNSHKGNNNSSKEKNDLSKKVEQTKNQQREDRSKSLSNASSGSAGGSKTVTKVGKKRNHNYYQSGKFNSVNWQAKVVNDETKQIATLVFTKNFLETANQLKTVKTKITKELNSVTKEIKKIKKDEKTGALLKSALTSQLNAYEAARKDFLSDVRHLYNGAINSYNDWMQRIYNYLAQSAITNQGSATTIQGTNISADDNVGIE